MIALHKDFSKDAHLTGSIGATYNASSAKLFGSDTVAHYKPSAKDVLMGRGKTYNAHPGNMVYVDIVNCHRAQYFASMSPLDKKNIIEGIVDQVLERGRFLKLDATRTRWVVVPKARALIKTAHALQYRQRKTLGKVTHRVASSLYNETMDQSPNEEIAAVPLDVQPAAQQMPKMVHSWNCSEPCETGNQCSCTERYMMFLRCTQDEVTTPCGLSLWQQPSTLPELIADGDSAHPCEQQQQQHQPQGVYHATKHGHCGLWDVPLPQSAPLFVPDTSLSGRHCFSPEKTGHEVPFTLVELLAMTNQHTRPCTEISSLVDELVATESAATLTVTASRCDEDLDHIANNGDIDGWEWEDDMSDAGMSSELLRVSSIGSFAAFDEELDTFLSDLDW